MIFRTIGIAAGVMGVWIASAAAHHSQAMYDGESDLEVVGTVEEFEWKNPHSWLYLMIEDDDGTPRQWSFETNSTGQLTRVGWAADSMKAGDEVTVVYHPIRDGTRGGSIVEVRLADGTVLPSGGQRVDPIRGSDAIIP
jgi:hypothetical protein